MQFQSKPLYLSKAAPKEATIKVGRFEVELRYDCTVLGGLQWRLANEDAVRPGEFPTSGKISHTDSPAALVILLLDELQRYDRFLSVEEEIARDPKRYEAIAKKALAEEEQAEANRLAAEEQAERDREAAEAQAERDREAAEEAARLEAEAEAMAMEKVARADRLARILRQAAEREVVQADGRA